MKNIARRVALPCLAAMATGCMTVGPSDYRSPAHGWELCRNEMPVDMARIDPIARADADLGQRWDGFQRTSLAGAVSHGLARRCVSGEIGADRAAAFDEVVVLGNYDANQVTVYDSADSGGTLRTRTLYIETPLYTDFRTDEFAANLDNGLLCYFAPASVEPNSCLPD